MSRKKFGGGSVEEGAWRRKCGVRSLRCEGKNMKMRKCGEEDLLVGGGMGGWKENKNGYKKM